MVACPATSASTRSTFLHHLPLLEEIIPLEVHRLPDQLEEVDDLERIGRFMGA